MYLTIIILLLLALIASGTYTVWKNILPLIRGYIGEKPEQNNWYVLIGVPVLINGLFTKPFIIGTQLFSCPWLSPVISGIAACLVLITISNMSNTRIISFRELVGTFIFAVLLSAAIHGAIHGGIMCFTYLAIFNREVFASAEWISGWIITGQIRLPINLSMVDASSKPRGSIEVKPIGLAMNPWDGWGQYTASGSGGNGYGSEGNVYGGGGNDYSNSEKIPETIDPRLLTNSPPATPSIDPRLLTSYPPATPSSSNDQSYVNSESSQSTHWSNDQIRSILSNLDENTARISSDQRSLNQYRSRLNAVVRDIDQGKNHVNNHLGVKKSIELNRLTNFYNRLVDLRAERKEIMDTTNNSGIRHRFNPTKLQPKAINNITVILEETRETLAKHGCIPNE